MNFTFTQDQLDFQDAVAAMLRSEVTADSIRARWSASDGTDRTFLKQAHDLGLSSMLVPEALGGLGLTTGDFILLAEACGEVALPEPIVESVMVVLPMLVDILDQGLGNSDVQRVIDGVLAGDLRVAGRTCYQSLYKLCRQRRLVCTV
jgi:alkylation response protein AidB-like acyl-CoA dehydrogenase